MIGTVVVANVAFKKYVAVRFTFDDWQTISEVTAEYRNIQKEPHVDRYDQFGFVIKLPDHAILQGKILLLCARYQVNGQEYWDNNLGKNFRLKFTRNPLVKAHTACTEAPSQRHIKIPDMANSLAVRFTHRSRADIYSAEYKDLIQKFCYFKPDDSSMNFAYDIGVMG